MGQQQLLLVILVTIIVGIATVVAINTFSSAAESAALDAVRQDLTQISASAQGYYMKPEMLGGGGNEFTGITLNDVTFGANPNEVGNEATNQNGRYVLGTVAADNFIVTGTANVADSIRISVRVCPNTQMMGDPGAPGGGAAPAPAACP